MQVSKALIEVYKAGYEDGEKKRANIEIMSAGEFLSGLNHADTLGVADDIFKYGNAFVETVLGKKRRVPPREWEGIIIRHELPERNLVAGYDILKEETRH